MDALPAAIFIPFKTTHHLCFLKTNLCANFDKLKQKIKRFLPIATTWKPLNGIAKFLVTLDYKFSKLHHCRFNFFRTSLILANNCVFMKIRPYLGVEMSRAMIGLLGIFRPLFRAVS
jgi:hypothetical protein